MSTIYNHIMQFHENPKLIALWCQYLSRFLTWFNPSKRRLILGIAALYLAFKTPLKHMRKAGESGAPTEWIGISLVIIALLAIAWLIYYLASQYAKLPNLIKRNPQLSLHAAYWLLLCTLWLTSTNHSLWHSVLFGIAICTPYLIWRFGYILLSGQHGRAAKSKLSDHFLTIWPAYGGSDTPYGKGLDFLSKFEAKNEEELAKSQLAGLKLILLATLWRIVMQAMETYVYGDNELLTRQSAGDVLGVPRLSTLVTEGTNGQWLNSWLSIYCELIWQVLNHAIKGLDIIAILRIFGFNVFRNTYKPLLSESIVEFWNRYYYYFKELLATFFFLPTFMQLGKKLANHPKTRLFAAVFAAAFIGNMYYHIIKEAIPMAEGNVYHVVYSLRSRFFYCLLLASGIYFSMLREQARAGKSLSNTLPARILRMAGVWTFFSLIFIWNVEADASFSARTHFFLGLFGLS